MRRSIRRARALTLAPQPTVAASPVAKLRREQRIDERSSVRKMLDKFEEDATPEQRAASERRRAYDEAHNREDHEWYPAEAAELEEEYAQRNAPKN